ncbi:ComF family protein [Marinobacter sp. F4216]|uniref:ComF family protein n=1 Tax=Marinobacter sp. F4216 TaxID=2874281 RepID=UPI00398A4C72|nr:ComF family protein [Marinobacter sp. F4216]
MIKSTDILSTLLTLKVNRSRKAGLCVACLDTSARDGLCSPCRHDLPRNNHPCQTCAMPMPMSGLVCGDCLSNPPSFSCSIIPWLYRFPADAMIRRFKDQGQRQFLRPLVADLASQLETLMQEQTIPRPDALIPAPMHRKRRLARGFNQAQVIAEELAKQLAIPVASSLVARKRHVDSQRGLGRDERLKNLRRVFELKGEVPSRIAIIDDVVTTGATARSLASALKNQGAQDIQVWALARTPL